MIDSRPDLLAVVPVGEHVRRVDLDAHRAIVFPGDGSVLFRHVCDRGARGVIICQPALQIGQGHTVVTEDPLTIVASILCPDCGTHGFVTDGRWIGV